MIEALPIEYHMEIYLDFISDDCVFTMQSTMPFPTMNVGDSVNPYGLTGACWKKDPQFGQMFRVNHVSHIYWVIEGSHIGHKLQVAVELVEIKDR